MALAVLVLALPHRWPMGPSRWLAIAMLAAFLVRSASRLVLQDPAMFGFDDLPTNPFVIAERAREDLVPYAHLHDAAMRTLLAERPGPDVRLPGNARRAVDEVRTEASSLPDDPHMARSSVPLDRAAGAA